MTSARLHTLYGTFAAMLRFCNAKINIGLRVLGKRPDGFHDLQSYFIPIPIRDALEIMVTAERGCTMVAHGPMSAPVSNNICQAAYELVSKEHELPGIEMHLFKTIPMGAGLGGGSSNAAAALHILNDKFELGMSRHRLMELGSKLGSDVPFFIENVPSMVTGRGEHIEHHNVDLKGLWMRVINPGIHCRTAEIFSKHVIDQNTADLKASLAMPITEWKDTVVNELENVVFDMHPAIAELKSRMYDHGALYASMSGSGSTVFGIFKERPSEWEEEGYSSWVFQL